MRYGLIFCLALALAGCSLQPQVPVVYLSGLHKIELPLPRELGRTVSLEQRVTAEFRGDVNDMLVALDVAAEEVRMVALTPFGAKLFSVFYQPPLIETEVSPLLEKRVKPEYILADLMLAYWPTEVLRGYLNRAGLSIDDNGSNLRVISLSDTAVIRVEYGDGDDRLKSGVVYHNIKRDYRLTMQTLEIE